MPAAPHSLYDSPLGPLGADASDDGIIRLCWGPGTLTYGPLADRLGTELAAYFAGTLTRFTVPLCITGTPFQRAFLTALTDIPYGETRTYGDLAATLGVSAQAIGQACGANPIPIVIPCHRVLGAQGLGGFSGPRGIEDKVALLRLEGAAGLLI
ncbi:methylated-DNA--[protein]-cysteine S-methyltransferase [Loktanella sp. M215]|uniref:methylated-DNA--[protein]-cysteine S-methyltransferase n=1 Tax=Loktanella sp. M215 TaxID=2675431 RepID=UPI001F40E108|nr:methylated-DNA--[protein]-cysteine S-methyltransferase [Loktanella sp. M215]MCF7697790.1 methylated-DNA--[protein]-cysteine S-methyltransferase [Loktanella sp. M215]